MIRTLYVFMVLGTIAGTLSGCETMEGAGRDIENAGEAIQRAVN